MRLAAAIVLAVIVGLIAANAPEVPDPIHRPNTVGSYR